ncbi:tyrosine-type recombinase/integrase [Parasediminibacterium sp. JCM 36343]|uniref:tyrosine-type recombinase/integrase n=1 Tax=Parasediminibacterium sp. JCM 36343 TaxID=3374279 RepID=UPI00397D0DF5
MNSIEKYLQQKGLSKSTIKCYNTEILEFIAWCDQQGIEAEYATSTDITGYMKHLQNKGQANVTRNINLNTLKHYFDYHILNETRDDNPARHIKIRGIAYNTLYPIFTKQELESIYHNYHIPASNDPMSKRNWFANRQLCKQRNKAILGLMVYQGLGTDEVNRLTVKDIRLREGIVFIAGTRRGNEREMELKPHQIMELMEYQLTVRVALQKLQTATSDLYFLPTPASGKKTITSNDGINIWKRLSQDIRANNKKFVNFLQVRASVITYWLQQYNLRQVQYMAGHRYVSTTENYLANNMEALQADIDQFHPIG